LPFGSGIGSVLTDGVNPFWETTGPLKPDTGASQTLEGKGGVDALKWNLSGDCHDVTIEKNELKE